MGPDIVKCEGFNTVRKQSSSKSRPAPKHYELAEGVTAAQVPEKLEDAIAGGFIRQVAAPKPTQVASVTEAVVTEDPVGLRGPVPEELISEPLPVESPELLLQVLAEVLKARGAFLTDKEGNKVCFLEVNYEAPKPKGVSF